MTEIKKPVVELKPEVVALSKIIHKAITVDGKAGTASISDGVYVANLPEGITEETVKTVSDFNTTFVAAGAYAFGQASLEAMKGSKTADRISLDIGFTGKDKVSYTIDRVKKSHNPQDPSVEITRYGAVSASLEMRAGKNGGQFKAVRTVINELALAALAK